MLRPPALPVIKSLSEARAQIERYQIAIADSPALAERMSRTHRWYALRSAKRGWLFAPSKFVSHPFGTAAEYLKHSGSGGQAHGNAAESALERWRIAPAPGVAAQIEEALDAFVASHGARRRLDGAGDAIWVLPDETDELTSASRAPKPVDWRARIVIDPDVCHGRPRIKGTRIRVTDILEMLAEGVTPVEIIEDFPSLRDEDVRAALAFAVHGLDHRVIQAAA